MTNAQRGLHLPSAGHSQHTLTTNILDFSHRVSPGAARSSTIPEDDRSSFLKKEPEKKLVLSKRGWTAVTTCRCFHDITTHQVQSSIGFLLHIQYNLTIPFVSSYPQVQYELREE